MNGGCCRDAIQPQGLSSSSSERFAGTILFALRSVLHLRLESPERDSSRGRIRALAANARSGAAASRRRLPPGSLHGQLAWYAGAGRGSARPGPRNASDLGARKNAYDRAFWCFLYLPEVFANARTLDHIEGLPRCSWEKQNGLPKKPIEFTEATVSDLGRRISEYYRTRDGRGENCKVEYRHRSSGLDSFFAYPADYVEEIMGYDEDGELGQTPWSGAFEVTFNYAGAAGTVELFAEGGKQVRDDLSEIVSHSPQARQQAGALACRTL